MLDIKPIQPWMTHGPQLRSLHTPCGSKGPQFIIVRSFVLKSFTYDDFSLFLMPPKIRTYSSLYGKRHWKGRNSTPQPTSKPIHSSPSNASTPQVENTQSNFPTKQAEGQRCLYIIEGISYEFIAKGRYLSQRFVNIFSQFTYPPSKQMNSLSLAMAHLHLRNIGDVISFIFPSGKMQRLACEGTKTFRL